jgi:hypothetical protein
MPAFLTTFQAEPDSIQTVQLGDAEFRVRLTWRERLSSWYLDLYTADGTALVLGKRLSASYTPLGGIVRDGLPAGGTLYVRGPNGPYVQKDLGASLLLIWYDYSELTPTPASAALRVEVL